MMDLNDFSGELITYLHLTKDCLPDVVNLHQIAFKGYMNTQMGGNYLFLFYRWFLYRANSIYLRAADKGGNTLGFVIGAPLGYDKEMNRDLFWVAARNILGQPQLLWQKNFRSAIINRGKRIIGTPTIKNFLPQLSEPTISLVSIVVSINSKRCGIGKGLMHIFEQQSKSLGMQSMRLSVYPDNVPARNLYESCNWKPSSEEVPPGQAMYYYKEI